MLKIFLAKIPLSLPANADDVPLEYLLGLLNSALISHLYAMLFKATHVGGAYLHYLGCYLADLPVRIAQDTEEISSLCAAFSTPRYRMLTAACWTAVWMTPSSTCMISPPRSAT